MECLDQVQIDFPMECALIMQTEHQKCLEMSFYSKAQIKPIIINNPHFHFQLISDELSLVIQNGAQ